MCKWTVANFHYFLSLKEISFYNNFGKASHFFTGFKIFDSLQIKTYWAARQLTNMLLSRFNL